MGNGKTICSNDNSLHSGWKIYILNLQTSRPTTLAKGLKAKNVLK